MAWRSSKKANSISERERIHVRSASQFDALVWRARFRGCCRRISPSIPALFYLPGARDTYESRRTSEFPGEDVIAFPRPGSSSLLRRQVEVTKADWSNDGSNDTIHNSGVYK